MQNNPLIYEINTWAWLKDLSRKYGRAITLGSVPGIEWDAIAAHGFDYIWLMGVWERSPQGRRIGLANPSLLAEFRSVLPDFNEEDFPGSPFSIRGYGCDLHLGGPDGLAAARQELARRGIRLILDFVPNHTAPDHPWSEEHPEYYVQGTREDLDSDPASYIAISGSIFARGRDPFFPAWADVIQLNLFHLGLRQALTRTLLDICAQCDGLRVDMAMLAIQRIFHGTWGERAGEAPVEEFWPDAIRQVKESYPDMLLIAESYWDTERELHALGFDLCYDKRLYDDLRDENLSHLRERLGEDAGYQARLVRFTENHDEQRAAVVFPQKKLYAADLAAYTLPGARMFHQGQMEGSRKRLPVLLGRRPEEKADEAARAFYDRLIELLAQPVFHDGTWSSCRVDLSGSPIFAWSWMHKTSSWLVAVNLSGKPCEAAISIPIDAFPSQDIIAKIRLCDLADPQEWPERNSTKNPVVIRLDAWGFLVSEITSL